jgi:hypothetical protein
MRRVAVAIAVLAFAAPAAAFADSAGDQQYFDPTQGSDQGGSGGSSGGGSSGGGSSGGGSQGAQTQQPGASGPTAQAAASSGSGRSELARTGSPSGTLAALGVALLAAGLGLRRAARAYSRP